MNNYPVTEFLRHNVRWHEEYAKAVSLELPDGAIIEMPYPSPPDAQVLKIRCMMLKEGVDPADEAHFGKVFHLSWMFWVHHQGVLFDSGLIRLNDGENAVLREELLRTLHQFFHKNPVPMPDHVSIHDVIASASQMNQEGEQGVAHQRAISVSISLHPPSYYRPWADIGRSLKNFQTPHHHTMMTSCDMEPGSDVFLPAKYVLRIFDAKDEEYPLLCFQMSTPPPKYIAGDQFGTRSWPLGQEGRLATVNRVLHKCWSVADEMWFEQNVYCDFQLPAEQRRESPQP